MRNIWIMLQQHRALAPPVTGSVEIAQLSPHFGECCDRKYTRRWLLVSDVANRSHPVPKSLLWKRHQTSYSWSISDQPTPSYPSNVELQNWISAPLDTLMSCTSHRTSLFSTWMELGVQGCKNLLLLQQYHCLSQFIIHLAKMLISVLKVTK